MNWFGSHNRIRPNIDYKLLICITGWCLAYFLLSWFVVTSKRRRCSTLLIGSLSFIEGSLLSIGLLDNCWLNGSAKVSVPLDRFHSSQVVPSIVSIHLGLTTINISCISISDEYCFHYNEEFQLWSESTDNEVTAALERGVPFSIISVLEFVTSSHVAIPLRKIGYQINYLLNMAFIHWIMSQVFIIFIPHIAPFYITVVGVFTCSLCAIYAFAIPGEFKIYVSGSFIDFQFGRSFYMVALGGLAYTILGTVYIWANYVFNFGMNTSFEIDYDTPWERQRNVMREEVKGDGYKQTNRRTSFYSTYSKPQGRESIPDIHFVVEPTAKRTYDEECSQTSDDEGEGTDYDSLSDFSLDLEIFRNERDYISWI